MQTPVVRRLVPSDAPAYRQLMIEAYSTAPEAFTSSAAQRVSLPLDWWESRVSEQPASRELVVGAFLEQALVGVAGLAFEQRERTSHKATLFGMYVSPSARGAGVGKKLIEEVLHVASNSSNTEVVQLTVTESNTAGLHLYTSCGFVPFGTEPLAVKLGSSFLNKVHMWREVPRDAP